MNKQIYKFLFTFLSKIITLQNYLYELDYQDQFIYMSMQLTQMFPQLLDKSQHYFNEQQFFNMPYFKDLSEFISQKQITNSIKKSKKSFKILNIKKGTIIYTNGMSSNSAFLLCYGQVSFLMKKNSKQKIQSNPKHVCHKSEQKAAFLLNQYGITLDKLNEKFIQDITNQFYQEKILFKYLEYRRIYGMGYFGFVELYRNINRVYTIIATEDSVLLEIQKDDFQMTLKDFESKKQDFMINSILTGNQRQQPSQKSTYLAQNKQLSIKFSQIAQYFNLRKYEKQQVIFKQGQSCQALYFLVKGQIELHKSFKVQMPKKLIQDQNKSLSGKQIHTKVSKLSGRCYFGQCQIFMNIKERQFTVIATQNNTIAIEIQPAMYLKMIGEFPLYQKELMILSKQKYSIAMESFLKQKNKVVKAFLRQFQNIQSKKQQKLINNLINEDETSIKRNLNPDSQLCFQLFSKQGIFFRDTYEKLQGFEQFQNSRQTNKRGPIRKHKIISNYSRIQNNIKRNQTLECQPQYEDDMDQHNNNNNNQKLLYSPKKTINIVQVISGGGFESQVKQNKLLIKKNTSRSNSQKKYPKQIGKFQQLAKDQAIFKRVLIKNGRYQQDNSTYKSNILKPIIHHKFDEIIKECMSRKNQVVRKALANKKSDVVKDTYQNTVESLKNNGQFMLRVNKINNFSVTCKGTDQFRKKMEKYKSSFRRTESMSFIRSKQITFDQGLKECIIGQTPNSAKMLTQSHLTPSHTMTASNFQNLFNNDDKNLPSHQSQNLSKINRTNIKPNSLHSYSRNSPQKFILMNHMMKPIVYKSVQY